MIDQKQKSESPNPEDELNDPEISKLRNAVLKWVEAKSDDDIKTKTDKDNTKKVKKIKKIKIPNIIKHKNKTPQENRKVKPDDLDVPKPEIKSDSFINLGAQKMPTLNKAVNKVSKNIKEAPKIKKTLPFLKEFSTTDKDQDTKVAPVPKKSKSPGKQFKILISFSVLILLLIIIYGAIIYLFKLNNPVTKFITRIIPYPAAMVDL
ncbi:MAG: hypothetical protein CMI53_04940 [Parcubacteria group bacterium]|nr:hypothetical protein [Parcubacteria group bacterium]|tara:strand:- start:4511 stop:5128 length:618 start_codon:yes stop_codon:yes gene_type:complete